MNGDNSQFQLIPTEEILNEIKKYHDEHGEEVITYLSKKYDGSTIAKILFNLFPTVGPIIGDYLSDKAISIKLKRIYEFIKLSDEALKSIIDTKIDKTFLNSEEFYYIFERIFERVSKTHSSEKINRFRNVFVNCCTQELAKSKIKDNVISAVETLTDDDVCVLQYIYIQYDRPPLTNQDKFKIDIQGIISNLKTYQPWQVELYCNDLINTGLLYDYNKEMNTIGQLIYGIRGFALEFRKFISDPTK